jgi:hypothetical protein
MNHYKILFAKVNAGNSPLGQSRLICVCPMMNNFTHPPSPFPLGLALPTTLLLFIRWSQDFIHQGKVR